MARPENKKTENEVIKASAAIQISGEISVLQRRAWNVLLANAYDELPHKERHSIKVTNLMETLEFDSKNDKYLKEALRGLINTSVEWNILNKDGETEWGAAALLAEVKIKGGICTYEYSSTMREKLYNPRMYARLCLSLQNKFDSKHTLALWEHCTDYLGAKRDYGETPWIDIDRFHKIMGVAESPYYTTLFKKLKQQIITPAVTGINSVSDFRVTVEYQHKGRKVTALKFKMRRVIMLPEPANMQAPLFPDQDDEQNGMPLLVKELGDAGLAMKDALEIWEQGFKFVDEAARPAASSENAEAAFLRYVREKIHLLKRWQASGKVENSTGFLLNAIKKNYANPEFDQEEKGRKAAEARKTEKLRTGQRKQLEERLEALKTARSEALARECSEVAATSPEVLETALPGILEANSILRSFYKSDQSALDNYRASFALQGALNPCLERHAPERIQAVKEQFAVQIASIEGKIAALQ